MIGMGEINTVHKKPNFKGIYVVLSRIWKCCTKKWSKNWSKNWSVLIFTLFATMGGGGVKDCSDFFGNSSILEKNGFPHCHTQSCLLCLSLCGKISVCNLQSCPVMSVRLSKRHFLSTVTFHLILQALCKEFGERVVPTAVGMTLNF